MFLQYDAWVVTVDVVEDVRESPIEGQHPTVVIAPVIPAFPPVHVVLPKAHYS
jgi:hypothetical protein